MGNENVSGEYACRTGAGGEGQFVGLMNDGEAKKYWRTRTKRGIGSDSEKYQTCDRATRETRLGNREGKNRVPVGCREWRV